MSDTDDRIRRALFRTATRESLAPHWRGLLRSRIPGPEASGSTFDVRDAADLVVRLAAARWEPFEHPDVRAPAAAFKTLDVGGRLGVVDLRSLPDSARVTLRDAHATGFLSAEVDGALGPEVGHAVVLLGPDDDGSEVVYTFHPGDPAAPSTVRAGATAPAAPPELTGGAPGAFLVAEPGAVLSPYQAARLGLTTAKVRAQGGA